MVTLEGLLSIFGIFVAILAIARPVQRRSLILFVPMWIPVSAIILSLVLIICRDAPLGIKPLFGLSLDLVLFGLTLGAFLAPVVAAIFGWRAWYRAKLVGEKINQIGEVFEAALREREFDEVERIVSKNLQELTQLPASAGSLLFSPAMVAALFESNSLVHLELLANLQFLRSLENRHTAVGLVVRELLRPDRISPLRAAVVSEYDGIEHFVYAPSDRALIERTFQNPDWYVEASAHYPLVISAVVEELQSGKYDAEYNNGSRRYETTQGISTRAYCPIYLAAKTEVLAIAAAIEARVEGDFYVSDLFDIFRGVQERSLFSEAVWKGANVNGEFPTPYAYLLYEIAGDLHALSGLALIKASSFASTTQVAPPGRVAQDLARTWSFCVWSIAKSEDHVSPEFRRCLTKRYLMFVLALGWQPSEIYHGPTQGTVEGIDVWRDLFVSELRQRFTLSDSAEIAALKDAVGSMDQGKYFVMQGHDWLKERLFG